MPHTSGWFLMASPPQLYTTMRSAAAAAGRMGASDARPAAPSMPNSWRRRADVSPGDCSASSAASASQPSCGTDIFMVCVLAWELGEKP
ncbi:Uncharacterised protein [Bordetella pertussis]|nr:Uncharacterised protein [Bordetella pertussis]